MKARSVRDRKSLLILTTFRQYGTVVGLPPAQAGLLRTPRQAHPGNVSHEFHPEHPQAPSDVNRERPGGP